jgi:hypothetical protein
MIEVRSKLRIIVLLTLLALGVAVFSSPAQAAPKSLDKTWMTNGKVYATALSKNRNVLYIGGSFDQVRPTASAPGLKVSNVAAINVASGKPLKGFRPQVSGKSGEVRALAVQGDTLFIGGNFGAVSGSPRQHLAAVDAGSGALSSFSPDMGSSDSTVYELEARGSTLYVGGGFEKVNGEARENLAAFNISTGNLSPSWRPKAELGMVQAIEFATDGNSMFIGGSFESVVGTNGKRDNRQSVARIFTASGNLHPWKIPRGLIPGEDQNARDIDVTEGRLFVGFGARKNYAASFYLTKGNVGGREWKFITTGNVQAIALSPNGSNLYIGGHFGISGNNQEVCKGRKGRLLRGIGSLDPVTGRLKNPVTGRFNCGWLPNLQGPPVNYNGVWSFSPVGNSLWVGGGFTGVSGVEQQNLARFTF